MNPEVNIHQRILDLGQFPCLFTCFLLLLPCRTFYFLVCLHEKKICSQINKFRVFKCVFNLPIVKQNSKIHSY